jgi:flavodoxin
MKTLIIYDSVYGNTEKIAEAIAEALRPQNEVKIMRVAEAHLTDIEEAKLLIVGSPTHGGRATPAMQDFLKTITNGTLRNTKVAAFDTRFDENKASLFLRLLVRIIKFAAPKIVNQMKIKGVEAALDSEGFIVEGKEGPLKAGELERAGAWAKSLLSK